MTCAVIDLGLEYLARARTWYEVGRSIKGGWHEGAAGFPSFGDIGGSGCDPGIWANGAAGGRRHVHRHLVAPYASLLRAAGDGSEAGDEPDSVQGRERLQQSGRRLHQSDLETMGGRSREEVRRHIVVRLSRSEPGQT